MGPCLGSIAAGRIARGHPPIRSKGSSVPKHCPWCGKELEEAPGPEETTPHGICDECARRLLLVRALWQYAARPEGFRVVVVRRAHAALYESVRRALEGFPNIRILLDRRHGERRKGGTPTQTDRRSGQDRRRPRRDLLLV